MTASNVKLDLSFMNFTWSNDLGDIVFNVQNGVFDALLPGLLPLLVVLGTWALLGRKTKPMTLILIMFVLGFILVGIKALCGAYV